MKNLKEISKRAMIGIIILTAFIYFTPLALAVSAEKGNFVILGRTIEKNGEAARIKEEMVNLLSRPDVADVMGGQLKSGTTVVVLQKVQLEIGEVYFQVSTFGRGGGMIGWVSEDYIYEVLPEPPTE